PVTSALIGTLCLLAGRAAGGAGPFAAMISWLGYINLALAGFNMIPGYPLDGGRVLRAAVWWKTGNVDRATRVASQAGQAVGILFIAWGILQFFGGAGFGGLWISFIGWFLLQASAGSYLESGLMKTLQGVIAADLMSNDCPALDGNLDVQHFIEEELLR